MASKVIKCLILNVAPITAVASHIGSRLTTGLGWVYRAGYYKLENKKVLLICFPLL